MEKRVLSGTLLIPNNRRAMQDCFYDSLFETIGIRMKIRVDS